MATPTTRAAGFEDAFVSAVSERHPGKKLGNDLTISVESDGYDNYGPKMNIFYAFVTSRNYNKGTTTVHIYTANQSYSDSDDPTNLHHEQYTFNKIVRSIGSWDDIRKLNQS